MLSRLAIQARRLVCRSSVETGARPRLRGSQLTTNQATFVVVVTALLRFTVNEPAVTLGTADRTQTPVPLFRFSGVNTQRSQHNVEPLPPNRG